MADKWIPLRLNRGVDTEADEKTLEPGTPTKIENGVFTSRVTVVKRFGTERLSRTIAGTTYSHLTGAIGLASRDDSDDLVTLSSDNRVLSYTSNDWVDRGDWVDLRQDSLPLPRGPYEAWDPTTASTGSVRVVAWEDARGGVYAQLLSTDGVAYGQAFRVGGTQGRCPRALAVGGRLHVYFLSGSTLNVGVLNASNPTAASASYVQIHPSVSTTNPMYDVVSLGNTARLAVSISASTYVSVIRADGNLGTVAGSPAWPNPVTTVESLVGPAIAASPDNTAFAVGYYHPGNNLACRVYHANTLQAIADSIVLDDGAEISSGASSVRRVGLCFAQNTGSDPVYGDIYYVHGFVETSASDPVYRSVRHSFGRHLAPQNVTSGTLIRHSSLASKPFLFGGDVYTWVNHPLPLQSTDYLVRSDGLVCARSRPRRASLDVSGTLANVDVRGNIAYRPATTRDLLTLPETSGSRFSGRHTRLLATELHPEGAWRPVDIDGVLHFGGGWPGTYDGTQVTELGFAHAIENVTVTPGSGSGGNLTSASYVWAVIPEAFDSRGNRYLGDGFLATGSISSAQNSASLSWPSVSHTMRDGTRAPDVRFAIYRTGPNGTVFQRVDDPATPVVNNTGSDRITFRDNVAESTRGFGEVIYTNGEEPSAMPLSPAHVTVAGDRLYMAGLEGSPYDIAVSKLRLGGGIHFAESGLLSVDSDGGPITTLASLRDEVIAFKRGRIFKAPDGGPGNSSSDITPWPLFTQVTSDVGAPDPATVVQVAGTTVKGLIFKSARGFRLLGDNGSVADIGGGVRAYDDLNVVGGVCSETDETVRFYTREGTTLVYNARFDAWSTFIGQDASAAALWRGRPTFIADDAFAYAEASGTYFDNNQPITMTVELGWMGLAGLQGEGRLREFHVLGNYHSPHTLRAEIGYDYREHWLRVREVDTSSSLRIFPYGTGSDPVLVTTGTQATLRPYYDLRGSSGLDFTQDITPYETVYAVAVTGTIGNTNTLTIELNDTWAAGFITLSESISTRHTRIMATAGSSDATDFDQLIHASSSLLVVSVFGDGSTPNPMQQPSGSYSGTFYSGTQGVHRDVMSYGYGSYGGQDPVYQLRFDSPIQKAQAFRLRFSDHGQDGTGQSYSLTEIKCLVTSRKGRPSLPRRKTI